MIARGLGYYGHGWHGATEFYKGHIRSELGLEVYSRIFSVLGPGPNPIRFPRTVALNTIC
jgi:hypothetical protein